MPKLLRRDAVRLFEASVEALDLALVGLGMPRRNSLREETARYAGHIGLIGAAAELAMAGCLVQTFGTEYLMIDRRRFKSGSEILEDFRKLLRNPVPRSMFLTQGVENPKQHLQYLEQCVARFSVLIRSRASGLHAGRSPSRDVCIILARDVADFISALAQSSRIKTYMTNIPDIPEVVKERQIILEDLVRSIGSSRSTAEQARILSSIYLVIPDLPPQEPEWLKSFERVNVSPQQEDIAYLLDVLERAYPGTLIKVSNDTNGQAIPVIVRRDDQYALPIAPQYLRRSLTSFPEQFHADIGTANGRLANGGFDVPPFDFVLELFVLGFEKTGILKAGDDLTPHMAWPLILSSLSVQGTTGPYWFFVRRTHDLHQLVARVKDALHVAPSRVSKRAEEFFVGAWSILRNVPLGAEFAIRMLEDFRIAEENRERLGDLVDQKAHERGLPSEWMLEIKAISSGELNCGSVLKKITCEVGQKTDIPLASLRYWSRILAEASTDDQDLEGLLAVFRTPALDSAHTAVRKAFRRIDFSSFGPAIETNLA